MFRPKLMMNALSLVTGIVLVGLVTSQGFGTWSSMGSSVPRPSSSMWNSISSVPGGSSSLVGRTVFGGSPRQASLRPPVPGPERIIGSTIIGRPLRMGEMGLPRHGGAGIGRAHSDGTRGGWDGNPATLHRFQQSWVDPLGGQPLPMGWNGDFRSISHMFG